MTTQNKNVPALRFPEFDSAWKSTKLGEVADVKRGAASQHLTYVNSAEEGIRLLRINDFLSDDAVYILDTEDIKRFRVKTNDILIAGTGATAGIVFIIPEKFNDLAFSYNAPRIRVNKANHSFILFYLKSEIILRQQRGLFVGNAQHFLDTDAMRGFKINLPTFPEQQKIAAFLMAVNEKIQQLSKKKDLLEQYKKGVIQQIFTQEIRFKDDNGNDFADWEEKPLSEVLDYEQPTKYLVSDTEYKDEYETPVLTAGKTFILGHTNETKGIFKDKLPVIIFDDFTTANKFVDFPFKAKSSAMKILHPKNGMNLKFIYEAMQNIEYVVGGHERHWISKYSSLIINVPCPEEQRKIADFLSSIDDKINLVNQQLEKTKTFEKGLLQQMLV